MEANRHFRRAATRRPHKPARHSRNVESWPEPKQLERYFLAPPGQRWTFEGGNDNWGLSVEGVDGTEHLEANKGRIDIDLDMYGHPRFGVLLIWSKWGGGHKENFSSKDDLTRLREWVRTLQEDSQ
jgi:hypothetical protein